VARVRSSSPGRSNRRARRREASSPKSIPPISGAKLRRCPR
jgi:hypothetical protein